MENGAAITKQKIHREIELKFRHSISLDFHSIVVNNRLVSDDIRLKLTNNN